MQPGLRDIEVYDVANEIEKGFSVSDDDLHILHSWFERMKEIVKEYDKSFQVSCNDCFKL